MTTIYLCREGHLVRADHSQVSIDSICLTCKRNVCRRAKREAEKAFARRLFDSTPRPGKAKR